MTRIAPPIVYNGFVVSPFPSSNQLPNIQYASEPGSSDHHKVLDNASSETHVVFECCDHVIKRAVLTRPVTHCPGCKMKGYFQDLTYSDITPMERQCVQLMTTAALLGLVVTTLGALFLRDATNLS